MSVAVIQGDARCLPLPDASVDLVVTSPPYFGLRSYTDGGEHYDGQIGSEATPQEWLANLLDCTREWVRVLKPSGSIFVNLGDKFSERAGPGHAAGTEGRLPSRPERPRRKGPAETGAPAKSLLGLPWRYALACTDQLGLILRRDIIWCLSGGARVYARTPTGDRPVMLRDLARSYQPGNVQLWNGQQWTQVLGWNRSPDRDGALELELRTGERIGCTPGHRWPTQRGVIRADDLRVGDVIQTTRLPGPDEPRCPDALSDDIGWLIGLYLAEGSRSGKTLQFAGHAREDIRHARLARIARAYDGACSLYLTSDNGVTCNLTGAVLVGIIDHYIGRGKTAKGKRLRKSVWQRQNGFLEAVAEGYLSGDGHHDEKNNRWRLNFAANDELAADLRTLAARLGAKISLRRARHTYGKESFPGWRGEWRWTRSAHHNVKQDGEVVAIRSSRAREFYDVGVADEPHLFALASGVLTHNSKPNGLPESVTDRCRSSHEYLFHLTKLPRYYSAVDEIREAYDQNPQAMSKRANGQQRLSQHPSGAHSSTLRTAYAQGQTTPYENPLGKLPGSVWSIPSQPLTVPPHLEVDHFAAFPMELPRRCVLGWSPPGICTACGEGRRPVVAMDKPAEQTERIARLTTLQYDRAGVFGSGTPGQTKSTTFGVDASALNRRIAGYACACPRPDAPTRSAVVLDPFCGTGTTMLVASTLGRIGIGVDRSADYCRLATWRCSDSGERARAMQVPKPPKEIVGQEALWT